ncbi:mercuric reductase [Gloeobacter morelensis]|uniref:Mercuric reductase n=1 Tax=Gloeobacter morelensis MG652769 TaxID=2781736 RepID=A0ABY3PIF2_9CYAN|nr:mercuric reductase [Gloeobacter morelensis]UFP93404.1 mercuric reductase [Gloeobacter morelensis MG652769]
MSEQPIGVAPMDIHNVRLVAHTHPPGWVNPKPAGRYNLVVVGGGTAGLVSAGGAALLGGKVALVERHLLGGDCLVAGCVPSKALIRSARAMADVKDAHRYGIRVQGTVEADFGAVMERLRRVRADISPHDAAERFKNWGVDVFLGAARFTSPDTVQVGEVELRFKRAIVATGGRAARPEIAGLAEAGCLTNETVFSLTERPERLVVIGGGPIGCELAQSFARLGSQVTLLHKNERVLDREDPETSRILGFALERDGVRVLTNVRIEKVSCEGSVKTVHLAGGEKVACEAILLAAGRVPNVEGLGLEAAGVRHGKGGVEVDDRLCTSNPRIYACGDICLPWKFTHAAEASARIALENALFGGTLVLGRKKASALTMPWCTYTDPEVAHVGLMEDEARERGIAFDTIRLPLAESDRALTDGEEDGFMTVILKQGSDKILGATLVARHAGEMISEITLAMVAGKGLATLSRVIHPYPTQAEIIRKVADTFESRSLERLRPFTEKWLAWAR